MAIVFQLDKSGNPSPEITCDGCGGVITDHTHEVAILETPSGEEPEKVLKPFFFVRVARKRPRKQLDHGAKKPIDQFLLRIANNVQLLPNDLEAAGRRMMKDSKYW